MNVTQLIAIAVIVILIAIYLIYSIKKKGLRKTAIDLIILAEEKYGSGQGEMKMESAIVGFLALLPIPIPHSIVRWFIQTVFDEIKDALNYQKQ